MGKFQYKIWLVDPELAELPINSQRTDSFWDSQVKRDFSKVISDLRHPFASEICQNSTLWNPSHCKRPITTV